MSTTLMSNITTISDKNPSHSPNGVGAAAECPQFETQRPRPFEIDSDYNFPWSSVARAQRPMESHQHLTNVLL